MERAILRQQLPHVRGSATRRGLIGRRLHPLNEARFEQRTDAHQHAAHGAVAADPVFDALAECGLNHRHVDRIENDDRVVRHAQNLRGVNPVPVPACRAQRRVDRFGVIAALTGDDHVHAFERGQVVAVFQNRVEHRAAVNLRRSFACGRGAEKSGLD